MSESSDPIPEIVASGREVVAEDVEPLWSDLMDGRSTAREAAMRARMLTDTANATHVASWGLSSLRAVTLRGVLAAEDVSVAHERWRRHVREYQADRWIRRTTIGCAGLLSLIAGTVLPAYASTCGAGGSPQRLLAM
jgi:hypothetical protein